MPSVLLLLSDQVTDVRELLPSWPVGMHRVESAPLKGVELDTLVGLHPDVLLVDATAEPAEAEKVTRELALAWEIGLPAIVVILDQSSVFSFRLDSGADDFLMTTATPGEITARLTMLDRRTGASDEAAVLRAGDVTINPDNYQVYLAGKPLDLTYKEFELLRFMAQRPGRVCDRDLLLQEVWGYDYFGGTRTVDVHIRRLRAKLGPEHEGLIETVRNVGYRLAPRPRDR